MVWKILESIITGDMVRKMPENIINYHGGHGKENTINYHRGHDVGNIWVLLIATGGRV